MDPIPDEPALGLQMALFQTEWVVESSVSSRFLNPLCLKESLKKWPKLSGLRPGDIVNQDQGADPGSGGQFIQRDIQFLGAGHHEASVLDDEMLFAVRS